MNTPVGLRMENDSRKSCEPPSALETVARIDAQMSRGHGVGTKKKSLESPVEKLAKLYRCLGGKSHGNGEKSF